VLINILFDKTRRIIIKENLRKIKHIFENNSDILSLLMPEIIKHHKSRQFKIEKRRRLKNFSSFTPKKNGIG
jgi:hypothetical protein